MVILAQRATTSKLQLKFSVFVPRIIKDVVRTLITELLNYQSTFTFLCPFHEQLNVYDHGTGWNISGSKVFIHSINFPITLEHIQRISSGIIRCYTYVGVRFFLRY